MNDQNKRSDLALNSLTWTTQTKKWTIEILFLLNWAFSYSWFRWWNERTQCNGIVGRASKTQKFRRNTNGIRQSTASGRRATTTAAAVAGRSEWTFASFSSRPHFVILFVRLTLATTKNYTRKNKTNSTQQCQFTETLTADQNFCFRFSIQLALHCFLSLLLCCFSLQWFLPIRTAHELNMTSCTVYTLTRIIGHETEQ